jgi:hypothetical protein
MEPVDEARDDSNGKTLRQGDEEEGGSGTTPIMAISRETEIAMIG